VLRRARCRGRPLGRLVPLWRPPVSVFWQEKPSLPFSAPVLPLCRSVSPPVPPSAPRPLDGTPSAPARRAGQRSMTSSISGAAGWLRPAEDSGRRGPRQRRAAAKADEGGWGTGGRSRSRSRRQRRRRHMRQRRRRTSRAGRGQGRGGTGGGTGRRKCESEGRVPLRRRCQRRAPGHGPRGTISVCGVGGPAGGRPCGGGLAGALTG